MTKPATTPEEVTLPTWTDAASVITYLTSLVSAVVAAIAIKHPGFTEPPVVAEWVPIVGVTIAGSAQLLNVWTHRQVQKAAVLAKAAASVVIHNNVTK